MASLERLIRFVWGLVIVVIVVVVVVVVIIVVVVVIVVVAAAATTRTRFVELSWISVASIACVRYPYRGFGEQ